MPNHNSSPRFIFFGSPEFARIVLRELVSAKLVPQAIVCNPDKPVGRKKEIAAPAVKNYAREAKLGVPILQPMTLSEIQHELVAFKPDLFVVAAYAKIIPDDILMIPNCGALGVHPSLLPRHRGASPIQTAILEGDVTTGTTIFLMDEKVDHGPILAAESCEIDALGFEALLTKLAEMGGRLTAKSIPPFLSGSLKPIPQKHADATFTSKFSAEDGFVDPEELIPALKGENTELALEIWRKVRALAVEPGVWTYGKGFIPLSALKVAEEKRVKILDAELKGAALSLKAIQIEGRNPTILR